MSGSYELVEQNKAQKTAPASDYVVTVQSFDSRARMISHVSKHRDGLGRITDAPPNGNMGHGYFLDPADGRLAPLVVQDSDTLKNHTPLSIRLAYWVQKSVIPQNGDDADMGGRGGWGAVLAKTIPGGIGLFFLASQKSIVVLFERFTNAYTAADPDQSRGFEDDYANQEHQASLESQEYSSNVIRSQQMIEYGMLQSDSGPKYLCFVNPHASSDVQAYECMSVRDFMAQTNSTQIPDYVFLSYTRKQFCVATDGKLREWNLSPAEFAAKSRMATNDRRTLGRLGCQAAKKAGLQAFWLDFECLVPDVKAGETDDNMADVYRICDIVRVCKTMVIVRGPPIEAKTELPSSTNKAQWLRQGGSRLWTVPEAILCPSREIEIYTLGEPHPEIMLKRRLAAAAWDDAADMSPVLEHFEGSLRLTPLELISIALEGLMRRQTDMRVLTSDMRSTGDTSYSLMGLLRRRPLVNRHDSDFEAFARLSLSNDSDKLLERLLCFLPLTQNAPWHEMKDAWDARLWDVEPHCQVAGIVDNRTIVLDGAYGATIQWHDLANVAFFKRKSIFREICMLLIRLLPALLITAIALLGSGTAVRSESSFGSSFFDDSSLRGATSGLTTAGAILLALALLLAFAMSWMLIKLFRGKFWSTQAWFFGMKGVPDLGEVEKKVFGINCGRLKWSATGSPLSRHHNVEGERIGLPPDGERDLNGLQLFTIVDTFTMTATAFYASKAPSVVIVCGREGGMQRALLCSYDWTTQSFCRESVLRMKTLVLQRMSRVDRFRLCLNEKERDPR
nr:hypothetical protein CFP56_41293 [Quercus suber]